MDDQILIIDDDDLSQPEPSVAGWKVMIVDDEPEVHRITKITLSKFEFDGKPIDFLPAHPAAEARTLGRRGGAATGLGPDAAVEPWVGGDGGVDGGHQLTSSRALVRRKPGMLMSATSRKITTETAAAKP